LWKMSTRNYWQHFRKMLTKNVGYGLKNVDEKMLKTHKKCWRKMFATFLKNVDEKILTTVQIKN
jgi:hypothetical protein